MYCHMDKETSECVYLLVLGLQKEPILILAFKDEKATETVDSLRL